MAVAQVTFLTPLSDAEFDHETGINTYLTGSLSDVEILKKRVSSPVKIGSPVKGNKSGPNKSHSPGKFPSYRDSLNGRLKHLRGKPGSRRNNRWRNELELGRREDELSDTGPMEDELEEYLFSGMRDNIFYRMFEEEHIMRAIRPFIDITEEEEAMLMEFFTESEWDDSEEDFEHLDFVTTSSVAYQRICTTGKRTVKKYSQTVFLDQLDSTIFHFIQSKLDATPSITGQYCSDTEAFSLTYDHTQLKLVMKDSFHRLIVHSICAYYNATSTSVLNEDGGKTVVIDRPLDLKFTPPQRLVEYLKTTKTDELYWQKPQICSDKKTKKKSKRSNPDKQKSRKSKRSRKPSSTPLQFGVNFVAPPMKSVDELSSWTFL